jgi:CheY-like chemotaxis protein
LPAIQQGTNGEEDNSPETRQQGKNELVLLVDDEESAQELGREILQENGYRVLIAGDGELGLELYKQYKSDIALVILDLMMPKLDGGQTFIELKKINPDVKAFFCSGHASSEVIGPLLAEENLRALSKPFEIDDFVRTVREVLDED